MKKIFVLLILSVAAGVLFADAKKTKKTLTIAERKAQKAALHLQRLKDDGGEIIRPGTMKGTILIANAQSLVDQFEVEEARDYLWDTLNFNIKVEKHEKVTPETAVVALEKSKANLALFIIEDSALPTLLVAPEEKWAIINASKLAAGAKTPMYTIMRLKKEIVRGFVYLCGGASSSYPGSMMGAVSKPSDLDRFAKIDLPIDVLMRFNIYLRKFGVTPAERVPYLFALDEPWCPPPADEYQKAVKSRWEAERAKVSESQNKK